MRSHSLYSLASPISSFHVAILVLLLALVSGCGHGQTASSAKIGNRHMSAVAVENEQARDPQSASELNTEQYAAITEKPLITALDEPQSTVSIDVDPSS